MAQLRHLWALDSFATVKDGILSSLKNIRIPKKIKSRANYSQISKNLSFTDILFVHQLPYLPAIQYDHKQIFHFYCALQQLYNLHSSQ